MHKQNVTEYFYILSLAGFMIKSSYAKSQDSDVDTRIHKFVGSLKNLLKNLMSNKKIDCQEFQYIQDEYLETAAHRDKF